MVLVCCSYDGGGNSLPYNNYFFADVLVPEAKFGVCRSCPCNYTKDIHTATDLLVLSRLLFIC